MRFIGNKENLLNHLASKIDSTGITKGTFCDFFSGTTSVGRFFKQKGFRIISSDLLYFSYVLQNAYIKNNKEPDFKKLLRVIKAEPSTLFETPLMQVLFYLNNLKEVGGFIFKNYTLEGTKGQKYQRMFFSSKNGKRIDSIRQMIEKWENKKLITNNEYYILLACLIETVPFYANISGTYAAFLKNYDPRALKTLYLRPIKLFLSTKNHLVFNVDSMKLLSKIGCDILYLDPPYNERQYGSNYHLLETIAKYDYPKINGVAGLRDYSEQKSDFCNRDKAIAALEKIASVARYKYLVLSYNSEGIMPEKDILRVLKKYGTTILTKIDYKRYKSNNNGDSKYKKNIEEQVYLLRSK